MPIKPSTTSGYEHTVSSPFEITPFKMSNVWCAIMETSILTTVSTDWRPVLSSLVSSSAYMSLEWSAWAVYFMPISCSKALAMTTSEIFGNVSGCLPWCTTQILGSHLTSFWMNNSLVGLFLVLLLFRSWFLGWVYHTCCVHDLVQRPCRPPQSPTRSSCPE